MDRIPRKFTSRLRRTSSVVAGLAAASLVLAACSSSTPSPSASSGGSSAATAKSITVFLIPSPTEDAIKARIPEFESQTGIKVNVVDAPYDQAHQKMLLSFQAKQGAYDVVQFDNPYLAPFASQNVL